MKKPLYLGLCVSVSLLLAQVGIAAADLVVIGTAETDFFVKGEVIDDDRVIEVPAGASVTLMDEAGKVVTIRGPYSAAPGGSAGAADRSLIDLVSALFTEHETAPLGVVRGRPGATPRDPWAIDASTPGDKCLRPGGTARLWQPGYDPRTVLTLTYIAAAKTVKVEWPAGAATLDWPREIPVQQGARYEAKLSSQMRPNRLVLHIAEDTLPNDSRALAWLLRTGCHAQARAFLGALPVDRIVDGNVPVDVEKVR